MCVLAKVSLKLAGMGCEFFKKKIEVNTDIILLQILRCIVIKMFAVKELKNPNEQALNKQNGAAIVKR